MSQGDTEAVGKKTRRICLRIYCKKINTDVPHSMRNMSIQKVLVNYVTTIDHNLVVPTETDVQWLTE